MPQPDAFALLITSTLITFGLVSSFAQMTIILTLYGKHGFVYEHVSKSTTEVGFTETKEPQLVFLSDTFAMDPGLANTWLMTMIPSVAVAAIIIHTASQRTKSYAHHDILQDLLKMILLWLTVFLTQFGLIMLVLCNIEWKRAEHYAGVIMTVIGGLLLNIWVIKLDYKVLRNRWHPQILFDTFIAITTICAIGLFGQPHINTSVIGEWLLLVSVWVCHALMPFRGARIVLSPPNNWKIVISEVDVN
jgi:hypothetical protein